MKDGDFGASFELNEIQHAYDINFAMDVARLASTEEKDLQIVDFGCGNGDKISGLLSKMAGGGEVEVHYLGADIDEKNVVVARDRVGKEKGVKSSEVFQIDLKDLHNLQALILNRLDASRINVYFFDNSLHFLDPNSINELLKICCKFAPPQTQVLATVCSIWNKTSIGDVGNKNQLYRIRETLLATEHDQSEILWRESDEIEHKVSMSHFTREAMINVFSKAGFVVQDCVWWNNVIYPNGISGLKENIKLRATK